MSCDTPVETSSSHKIQDNFMEFPGERSCEQILQYSDIAMVYHMSVLFEHVITSIIMCNT